MIPFRLICCIVNMGEGSNVLRLARKYGVKGGTISIGRGTVHSGLLEFLKINEVRREIVTMIVAQELAAGVLHGLGEELKFEKPNHGIAFSLFVGEFTGHGIHVAGDTTYSEVSKAMYKAIYVAVDKGNAEDVIEAANRAGARGGTIFNARGSGIHEAQKLFSVEIELEKEMVLIIAKSEMKDSIVSSIRTELNLDTPGNGILFVMDVGEAYGLYGG